MREYYLLASMEILHRLKHYICVRRRKFYNHQPTYIISYRLIVRKFKRKKREETEKKEILKIFQQKVRKEIFFRKMFTTNIHRTNVCVCVCVYYVVMLKYVPILHLQALNSVNSINACYLLFQRSSIKVSFRI